MAQGWMTLFNFVMVAFMLAALAWMISMMSKRDRIEEINAIWYVFSLVLVVRWAVDFAAWSNGYRSLHDFLEKVMGIPSSLTLRLHDWLTNIGGEVMLVASVIVVAVLPQLMTYALAGIFGCARSPPAVWIFEKLAAWSAIKFLAAFSAILLEAAISPTDLSDIVYGDSFSPDLASISKLVFDGTLMLALAFALAFFQTELADFAAGRSPSWRWCMRLHRLFTRNLPQPG
jgi:hypothetical protein